MQYKAQIHKSLDERVWEKVNKNGPVPNHQPHLGECWVWIGFRDKKGYGRLNVGYIVRGRYHGYPDFAHRVVWELVNGALQPGLCLLHRCDNPACVRPAHLFTGDRADNNRDRYAKGRYSNCPNGELVPQHRLTTEQVLEIRAICKPGKCWHSSKDSYSDLARKYGVTYHAIRLVVLRKNWKHL